MKSKIITLIIGILIGAILASAGFMIYNKVNENNRKEIRNGQMQDNGERPNGRPTDMEDGDFTPPEKPTEETTDENAQQPTEEQSTDNSL